MKQLLLATFLIALPVAGFTMFETYFNSVPAVAGAAVLGDLTAMQVIIKDTLAIAQKGDFVAAEKRISDFETLWDNAEPTLLPMNKDAWANVDAGSDGALKSLRSKTPDAAKVKEKLEALLASLSDPSKPVN